MHNCTTVYNGINFFGNILSGRTPSELFSPNDQT